jgi:hypothetical protein
MVGLHQKPCQGARSGACGAITKTLLRMLLVDEVPRCTHPSPDGCNLDVNRSVSAIKRSGLCYTLVTS